MLIALFVALLANPSPLEPGLTLGKRPGPFSFLVASGSERGKLTCYICEQDTKPTTVVFARTLTPALGELLTKLDTHATGAGKATGYRAWMTLLTNTARLDDLANWSRGFGLKTTPIGAYEDTEGPPAYRIRPDAEVTVIVFVDRKVTATWAFRNDEFTTQSIPAIVKAAESASQKRPAVAK